MCMCACVCVCVRARVLGFPGGSDGKESACNVGDPGLIPGSGRSPEEGKGYPFPYSCLENPHGQSSLAGYTPLGCKESDTTERLSTAHSLSLSLKGYILFASDVGA